jgi:hypothetical protein
MTKIGAPHLLLLHVMGKALGIDHGLDVKVLALVRKAQQSDLLVHPQAFAHERVV